MRKCLVKRMSTQYQEDAVTGCWNWTASLRQNGYGQIKHDGKNLFPHRVSYEMHVGPIPEGLCVCHRCDNRACINPDHFFLGTRADNNADRSAKGRSFRGVDPRKIKRGSAHGNAKLTESQVAEIRLAKGVPYQELSQKYGVGKNHIGKIRRGESWTAPQHQTGDAA